MKTKKWLALALSLALLVGVLPYVGTPLTTSTVDAATTESPVTVVDFSAEGKRVWLCNKNAKYFGLDAQCVAGGSVEYTVSFSYYLIGKGVNARGDNPSSNFDMAWPGGNTNYVSGDLAVHPGKGTFTVTVKSFYNDGNETCYVRPLLVATGEATLYFWNFTIKATGSETVYTQEAGHTAQQDGQTNSQFFTATVSVGDAPSTYDWSKEKPTVTNPLVEKLVFNAYQSTYYFPTLKTDVYEYSHVTWYTLSFDYYCEFPEGTLSANNPAWMGLYNADGSKDTANKDPWGFELYQRGSTYLPGDITNSPENTTGRKLAWNTSGVYIGFKNKVMDNITINVAVAEGETFMPALYAYGAQTMYIWDIEIRANDTPQTDLNDAKFDTTKGGTISYAGRLMDMTFAEAETLKAYNEDTAVIQAEFKPTADDPTAEWCPFRVGIEDFGFTANELAAIKNSTNNRVLVKLSFDYYLYSAAGSAADIVTTIGAPTGAEQELDYPGGYQNILGGDSTLYATDLRGTQAEGGLNKKFEQYVSVWQNYQIVPQFSVSEEATLSIWNVQVELLPDVSYVSSELYTGVNTSNLYDFSGQDYAHITSIRTPFEYYTLGLTPEPQYFTNLDFKSQTTDNIYTKNVTLSRGLSATNYAWHSAYHDYRVVEVKFADKAVENAYGQGQTVTLNTWWMMSARMNHFNYSSYVTDTLKAVDNRSHMIQYTLSFDYYLSAPDGQDVTVYRYGDFSANDELNNPGGCTTYISGDTALKAGANGHFKMTMASFSHYEARPTFHANGKAKLYIWNVQIECNGIVYHGWMQETGEGITQNYFSSNDNNVAMYSAARARQIKDVKETDKVTGLPTAMTISDYDLGRVDLYTEETEKLLGDLRYPLWTDVVKKTPNETFDKNVATNGRTDTEVFVGWTDDEGDAYYIRDLVSAYHTLEENWYTFSTEGTSIRYGDDKPGLRFRFGIDPRFAENIPDLKRWAVVIPESLRYYSSDNHVLTDGAGFTYSGKTYTAETTECPLYFSPAKDLYTLVITPSVLEQYKGRVYAARGRLTFTSLNGHTNREYYTEDLNEYTSEYAIETDKKDVRGTMAKSYNTALRRVKEIAAAAANA